MEGIKQLATAKRRAVLNLPFYSLGEEIWNAVSHGIGAGLSIAALVLLMVFTPKTPIHIFSLLVYSISMILLYVISTLYHALPVTKGKKIFQILDHCTIFFMIAGTYTPMLLLCVKGITGWVMLGVVWAASVIGILLNAVDMKRGFFPGLYPGYRIHRSMYAFQNQHSAGYRRRYRCRRGYRSHQRILLCMP